MAVGVPHKSDAQLPPGARGNRVRVPTLLCFQSGAGWGGGSRVGGGGSGVGWGGRGWGMVTFTHKDISSRRGSHPLDFFFSSPLSFQTAVRVILSVQLMETPPR